MRILRTAFLFGFVIIAIASPAQAFWKKKPYVVVNVNSGAPMVAAPAYGAPVYGAPAAAAPCHGVSYAPVSYAPAPVSYAPAAPMSYAPTVSVAAPSIAIAQPNYSYHPPAAGCNAPPASGCNAPPASGCNAPKPPAGCAQTSLGLKKLDSAIARLEEKMENLVGQQRKKEAEALAKNNPISLKLRARRMAWNRGEPQSKEQSIASRAQHWEKSRREKQASEVYRLPPPIDLYGAPVKVTDLGDSKR